MDNGAESYRRFLDGDDFGMAALIREYRDGLMLYLNSIVNDLDAAEDCVQDTFIRLAVKKPKFRGGSTFKTWLYTIGRNIAVTYLQRAKRHSTVQIDECISLTDETDLEQDYLREERKIIVHRAVNLLKPDYAQVLHLTYFEGFSNREAADIMKKSGKQIENLLYHAKRSLRAELEKEGFHYEDL